MGRSRLQRRAMRMGWRRWRFWILCWSGEGRDQLFLSGEFNMGGKSEREATTRSKLRHDDELTHAQILADDDSFGSTWFPVARPDIVHNLLDTLLSTSTPFVFAYATELFDVPQDLIDKVKDAEFGLAVKIAPQVQVLNHPAVGFFVSHAGANSLAESVLAGVPLVTIGFAADQGEHAAICKSCLLSGQAVV